MPMLPRVARIVACAATAAGAGMLLGASGWLGLDRRIEFSGLIAAAILMSAFATRRAPAADRGTMPPSFVLDFMSLLLFGPGPAMLVASAGVIAKGRLAHPERLDPPLQVLMNAVAVTAAALAAGLAHGALGGTLGHFIWPSQGVPIAGAVLAYGFVKGTFAFAIGPLAARQPVNRSWLKRVVRQCPMYFIGAGVAIGLVEVLDRRAWEVLPVAAVPLYFAYRLYSDYVNRLDDETRRREVIGSLDEGMCVLDSEGRVTLWSDALERLVGCARDQALGGSLVGAVPALRDTPLPRAVSDALKDRSPRTLSSLGLPTSAGARILEVKILPVAGGITLLWSDITKRTQAEESLKRSTERLALAAEGANDGLWEWDLRTHELYFSTRWRVMLGLPAPGGIGPPQQWLDRVHADDVAGLKDALKEHVGGQTEHFQHEHRLRHEDGTYRWFLCRGIAAGGGRSPSRIAGSLTDTTDRVLAEERLRTAQLLDPLTGLRNRVDFLERLGKRLDEFKQRRGERFAVLYLDLDRLKLVNDSLGHPAGDELLIAVSRRLESCLRDGDCLGRLGGDEFAILLSAAGDGQQANAVAFRIQEALNAPLSIAGREVFTSVSIGIAVGDAHYTSPDEIMRDADTAMYHAKARGKARHELFDTGMHDRARDRLGFENDLRRAVNNNDFEVHYQPIVSLASGMCIGFESLVRWTRNGEAISPATFIPIAEELGVIEPLGTWVLQQACQTFADWQRRFPAAGLTCITVNASSRQLTQAHFPHLVEQAVHAAGLNPCDLRIEVTETALMDNPHLAAKVLTQLRDFGVKIYLDDFGTGCSSLSHLHKLPVDALKIDRSFVTSLLLPDRPAIVESILALARTLKTSVVAEGIETDVQAHELERLGCTHAQGYLFSRPLSAPAAEKLIIANQPLGHKRVPDAVAADDADRYYASKPFEWPEQYRDTGDRRLESGAHVAPVAVAPTSASSQPALAAR